MAGFSLSRRDLMTGGLSIAGLSITGLTACSPRKDAKSGDLSKESTLSPVRPLVAWNRGFL